jgi:hypothetical protein
MYVCMHVCMYVYIYIHAEKYAHDQIRQEESRRMRVLLSWWSVFGVGDYWRICGGLGSRNGQAQEGFEVPSTCVSMYVFVCMCLYLFVCMSYTTRDSSEESVCVCIWMRVFMHLVVLYIMYLFSLCMYVCMYVCTYVCVCACASLCLMYMCLHVSNVYVCKTYWKCSL